MLDLPDSKILPLSLEHIFWTWSAQAEVSPIPVTHAMGVYFWDTYGKRYLDFNSMTMCVNIGHGDQRVINAIIEQALPVALRRTTHGDQTTRNPWQTLSRNHSWRLEPVLFTLGSADANENAVKLARAYTGGHKILARYRSYHGASAGAIALTGDPRRVAWEPNLMPGVVHFLGPLPLPL